MNVGARGWIVVSFGLALACQDDGDGNGAASGSGGVPAAAGSAGVPGGSGGGVPGGSGGYGGSQGLGETCAYSGARKPSTITGSGFDAWDGQTASGCYLEAQLSNVTHCDTAIIVDGGFSLTASTCGGPGWRVWIGDDRTCWWSDPIRPEDCECGRIDSYAPTGSPGCDAGVP